MTVPDPGTIRAILGGLPAAFLAMAVKGILFFLAASLVDKFARSLRAEHRHTLWLVVILALGALPASLISVPLFRVPLFERPAFASALLSGSVPALPPASPGLAADPAEAGGQTTNGTGGSPAPWAALALAGAWAAGAALVAARPLAGRIALSRALRRDRGGAGPEALLRELAQKAGVRNVRVLARAGVTIPFTHGVLRPVILLPAGWATWDREALEAVLLHELAHVRRRDAISILAAQLACAAAWFNPLAWIARSALLREAELSCDQEVVSHGVSRTLYASTILRIVRGSGGAGLRPSWSALGGKKRLKDRIRCILFAGSVGTPRRRRARVLTAVVCLAVPLLLTAVSFQAREALAGQWRTLNPPRVAADNLSSWNEDGSGSLAHSVLPDVPARWCRYVIEKKWTDQEGFRWYHLQVRWSGMPFILYTLIKLDPSGKRYEETDSPLGYPGGFSGPAGTEKHLLYARR